MIGVPVVMDGDTTPNRAVVLSRGHAYGIDAAALKCKFEQHSGLQHLLPRYTLALITQISQTSVSTRHHVIEQQFCRWLLQCLELVPGNQVMMTQELVATVLGVRREGITDVASRLRNAGILNYVRGRITILDRARLEACSCECYAEIKREYERLLPASGRPEAGTRLMPGYAARRAPGSRAHRTPIQATR